MPIRPSKTSTGRSTRNCRRNSCAIWPPVVISCVRSTFCCVVRLESTKTHLAEGLGHQAAWQGYRVEFIKTSRLLSDLGGGHADGTWDGRLRHYLLPAVLILDDFAMHEYTSQQA